MTLSASLLLIGALSAAGPATVSRFALVVGNNVPPAQLTPLRYADDDAGRLYEFLNEAGYTSRLLTVLDPETQSAMPALVGLATPPTRAALLEQLGALNTLMRQEKARGHTVEFLFAFAGHGQGSTRGDAAIFLLDSPFTRTDLWQRVVQDSPADFIHLVVDACDSYLMVAGRGTYPDDRVAAAGTLEVVHSYLQADDVAADPRTGFLVSTNQAAQSHEYDGYHAGVFSYVLHSALAGAADANHDGRVEYSEVLAYTAAASQDILDPRARLTISGRAPPRDVHRPVVDLASGNFSHFLKLGAEVHGKLHVEDARAVRYADMNKPAGTQVLLALVDSPAYRVVLADGQARFDMPTAAGAIHVGAFSPLGVLARGEDAQELGHQLFAVPFDESFYRGFVSSQGLPPARMQGRFEPPDAHRAGLAFKRPRMLFAGPGLTVMALGGVLGGAAALTTAATAVAWQAYRLDLRQQGTADPEQELRINVLRVVTGMLVAGGLAALAAGGILVAVELLWPVSVGGEP